MDMVPFDIYPSTLERIQLWVNPIRSHMDAIIIIIIVVVVVVVAG
jgi:hypothetical protein